MGQKVRTTTCCCGSLTAEAVDEPVTVLMCSCEQCQRRTGSAFGDDGLPAPVVSMWEKRKQSWAIAPGHEHHPENPPTVPR